jgi:hypothetical protein
MLGPGMPTYRSTNTAAMGVGWRSQASLTSATASAWGSLAPPVKDWNGETFGLPKSVAWWKQIL